MSLVPPYPSTPIQLPPVPGFPTSTTALTSNPFQPATYTPDEVTNLTGQTETFDQAPDRFEFELTEIKVHAIALTRWLNQRFMLREGVPTPVIWASPMDAFSQFDKLWQQENSPFAYLKGMPTAVPVGAMATPPASYSLVQVTPPASAANPSPPVAPPQVYPVNQRYPLISVDFRAAAYSAQRSYSGRVYRRLGWPSVEPANQAGMTLSQLGWVQQARMPLAFDYRYQIDHWALRPDTQAFFIRQLFNAVKASGAELQTYVFTLYPAYYGNALVKMRIDPDIQDTTEKDPVDNTVKYRTTIQVTLEGWAIDQTIRVTPNLWSINNFAIAYDPNALDQLYLMTNTDLRPYQQNPVLGLRQNLPPGTVVGSFVVHGTNWGTLA